jgi:hypothetical protein
MNFQEKLFETTAELRSRAQAFANTALHDARQQADVAAKRFEKRFQDLRGSIDVLNTASRKLNTVARRHASQFVKQNSTIAAQVRDDVSALARSTFATLAKRPPAKKARKATTARKRARKAA